MIKINGLNYKKDDTNLLTNINLEVKKGEYLSLLGENGSGKSTLALLITGIIEKEFEGIEVDSSVALVLENPDNQLIGTTVEEDIAFGLQNLQKPREEIEDTIKTILRKLEIEDLRYREITSLSGGQKQKVAFASLLALDYEVYILDEVTSMLDPESKKMVLSLIDDLHKEGKTIIQITHFIEEAELTKRSIVMQGSKIIYDGLTTKLLKNKKIIEENKLI